jgi:hypothetical protein
MGTCNVHVLDGASVPARQLRCVHCGALLYCEHCRTCMDMYKQKEVRGPVCGPCFLLYTEKAKVTEFMPSVTSTERG